MSVDVLGELGRRSPHRWRMRRLGAALSSNLVGGRGDRLGEPVRRPPDGGGALWVTALAVGVVSAVMAQTSWVPLLATRCVLGASCGLVSEYLADVPAAMNYFRNWVAHRVNVLISCSNLLHHLQDNSGLPNNAA